MPMLAADAPQQLDQQQPGPKQEQQPPGFSSFKFSSELPPLGPGTSGASGAEHTSNICVYVCVIPCSGSLAEHVREAAEKAVRFFACAPLICLLTQRCLMETSQKKRDTSLWVDLSQRNLSQRECSQSAPQCRCNKWGRASKASVAMQAGSLTVYDQTHAGAASGGKRGKASGGRASGAGKASGGGPKGPRPPELSVLAAITAVKKLCCHPDLVL
eukprot:scaffold116881_cov18-Tisochrysis_lutea.AAC.3